MKKIFIIVLLLGIFLRIYQAQELFIYAHDEDLAGWIIKDIVVDKHFRLVGQLTSTPGVFIGPLFYYLLIPFYIAFNMDPVGGLFLALLFGVLSIISLYFVVKKIFGKRPALIATFVYAASYSIVFTDRQVVPTTPVILWSIWYFYGVFLLLKGKQVSLILLGILLGLIWNINLALALLVPLIPLALILSKRRLNVKFVVLGLLALFISSTPFIVFELKHNFQQIKAISSSLLANQNPNAASTGIAKFDRVLQLVFRNTSAILWGNVLPIAQASSFIFLLFSFLFLSSKKIIEKRLAIIVSVWVLLYVVFFSVNSINVSEYYLNGITIIWVTIFALVIAYLLEKRNLRNFGIVLLLIFSLTNLYKFITHNPNRIGYLQKKAIVRFIKEDAEKHRFPCVAVAYNTYLGYELGYRYFFYLENMHINQPISESPVYTIVFPHSKVGRIDRSFGALGLILPDYQKYNEKDIAVSCSGQNSNLTDPMFGYVE